MPEEKINCFLLTFSLTGYTSRIKYPSSREFAHRLLFYVQQRDAAEDLSLIAVVKNLKSKPLPAASVSQDRQKFKMTQSMSKRAIKYMYLVIEMHIKRIKSVP